MQGYQTNDGKKVVEGVDGYLSDKEARIAINKEKRDAIRIIERVPDYRNHLGDVGERIVLEYGSNDHGEAMASILFYDGGDSYRYIYAPSLDLALEFEQYLVGIQYRSPM